MIVPFDNSLTVMDTQKSFKEIFIDLDNLSDESYLSLESSESVKKVVK